MQSDLPHTLYKKTKDAGKKANGGKAPVRADDPAFKLQQEAYERKLAKIRAQAEGQAPMTMEEIFRQ